MLDRTVSKGYWEPKSTESCWVFPTRPEESVNQLVDFYQTFTVAEGVEDATLLISADTDFVVWLNGRLIGYGQYSDFPDQKTYETFSVADVISPGQNALAVTVFYNGRGSSVYRRGEPGVVFTVIGDEILTSSGPGTLQRQNPCYHSGPIASVSGQLFYTFGYDARSEDGFNSASYSPGSDWSAISESEATVPDARFRLLPRPVSRLVEDGLTACRLHACGMFRRDLRLAEAHNKSTADKDTAGGLRMSDGNLVSSAWLMQHDYLSPRTSHQLFKCAHGTEVTSCDEGLTPDPECVTAGDGVYMVFDMGQQEVGHIDIDIEAPAGTILDIGYGEHLEDLRVRTFVGGRNFAGRYICREGRQQFVHHFQRWAGRYLAVHSNNPEITCFRVNLQRRQYPVTVQSRLQTGDQLHQQILEVAQRTLHCCMHEHYEDTPWREQALYANDSRTQALCGYYAFGETAFPASSFSLLGRSLRDDGFLCLTAPAKVGLTIPSFTFCWMLAVRDQYLYSGDPALAKQFLPQMCSMLKSFLDEREDGLLPLRNAQGIWHFYDWSGMSGYSQDLFDSGLKADAPLNCFFILALESALEMMDWLGEDQDTAFVNAATDLRNRVADEFWNDESGVFVTHTLAKRHTQLTQALAVLAGVGTEKQQQTALTNMAAPDSGLTVPGLSQTLYTFSALMTQKDLFGEHVLKTIEDTWGSMLRAGATTFWETIKGAGDFHNAGSLCHAWSAVPVYVYYHDLLGIRPLAPGFKRVAIEAVSSTLPRCSGSIPVPSGTINLSWTRSADGTHYIVDAPAGCEIELRDPTGTLTLNGN